MQNAACVASNGGRQDGWIEVRETALSGSATVVKKRLVAIVGLLSILLFATRSAAATCTVSGSHQTIQEAVADASCTTINLSSTTYSESVGITRSLTLVGQGAGATTIEGLVQIQGSGTDVHLQGLKIQNGCEPEALESTASAKVQGSDLVVVRSAGLPCPPLIGGAIFSDGFESGDTSAWTSTVQ